MWANRAFSFVAAFLCWTTYLSAADDRTWTDTNGQTMQGELLEVTADDKAVIRSKGKVFTIPLTRFSAPDLQVIQAFQEKGSESVPEDNATAIQDFGSDPPKAKPTRRPRRKDLFDHREWTNSEGQTIRARYVRIHEGLIVLMQGKKGIQAPFEKLSAADQEFLRTHLEARGEADQLPDIQPPTPEGIPSGGSSGPSFPSPAGMPSQIAGNSAPSNSSFPAPSGQAYFPQPETPAYDPADETSNQVARSGPDLSQYEPEAMAAQEPSAPPTGPSFPPPETRRQIDELREESRSRREEMLSQQQTYICTNCNQELPDHIGAGDHCPHCRAYIAYEENEYGQKNYATNQNNGQTSFRWRRRSGIGLAIAVLVAIIRFGMKALNS